MEAIGINFGYLLIQCILPLAFLLAWSILSLLALRELRGRPLPEDARAIWAVLIVVVPFLGALAFFVVRPGGRQV